MTPLDIGIAAAMTLCGVAFHVLKELVTARKTEHSIGLKDYLLKYPYQMGLMVIGAIVLFVSLHEMGELSMLTAFMAGYMANSAGDILGDRAKLASKGPR